MCRTSTQWVLGPTDSKTLSLQSEYVPEASGFPLKACVGIAARNNNYTCWSGLFTKETLHSETSNKWVFSLQGGSHVDQQVHFSTSSQVNFDADWKPQLRTPSLAFGVMDPLQLRTGSNLAVPPLFSVKSPLVSERRSIDFNVCPRHLVEN